MTTLQGCLRYPYRSIHSCPDCSPWCSFMFLSFSMTFQAGIHLDVQLYDKVCTFLKDVWQVRSAWNILVWFCCCCCARKYLRCFAPVEEAGYKVGQMWIKFCKAVVRRYVPEVCSTILPNFFAMDYLFNFLVSAIIHQRNVAILQEQLRFVCGKIFR